MASEEVADPTGGESEESAGKRVAMTNDANRASDSPFPGRNLGERKKSAGSMRVNQAGNLHSELSYGHAAPDTPEDHAHMTTTIGEAPVAPVMTRQLTRQMTRSLTKRLSGVAGQTETPEETERIRRKSVVVAQQVRGRPPPPDATALAPLVCTDTPTSLASRRCVETPRATPRAIVCRCPSTGHLQD